MNTDRFDETIRQKLDSIQPAYHETAWQKLQQTLIQHGIVSTGTVVGGWLSALTALTVAGLIGTTVYLYRSNVALQTQVGTLTRTVTRLDQQRRPALPTATARIDTVYLTQPTVGEAVTGKTSQQSARPADNAPGDGAGVRPGIGPLSQPVERLTAAARPGADPTSAGRVQESVTPARPARPTEATTPATETDPDLPTEATPNTPVGNPAPTGTMPTRATRPAAPADVTRTNRVTPHRAGQTTRPLATQPVGRSAAPSGQSGRERDGTQDAVNEPVAGNGSRRTTTDRAVVGESLSGGLATNRTKMSRENTGRVRPNQSASYRENPVGDLPDGPANGRKNRASTSSDQPGQPIENQRFADLSLTDLTNRPLLLDPMETGSGIDRRVRRLRYLFPLLAAPATPAGNPTETESRRVAVNPAVRLGVSGELDGIRTGGGVYLETRLGNHWTLGLGLNRLSQSGGSYLTDEQFNESTRRNFRRDYNPARDPRFDPRFEINSIDISRQSWQLPLSVGYRLPLRNGFALTPTLGLSLTLSGREQVSFTYQRGPRDFGSGTILGPPPAPDWFNTASLSLGAEKSWGHWTIQVVPFIALPTTASPGRPDSPDRVNATTGGIRLRLLYGF
jgi:hypothetical protein